jgi:hypothetical protein
MGVARGRLLRVTTISAIVPMRTRNVRVGLGFGFHPLGERGLQGGVGDAGKEQRQEAESGMRG